METQLWSLLADSMYTVGFLDLSQGQDMGAWKSQTLSRPSCPLAESSPPATGVPSSPLDLESPRWESGGDMLFCEAPECMAQGSPICPGSAAGTGTRRLWPYSQFRSRWWDVCEGERQGTGVEPARFLTPVCLSLIHLLWLLHHLKPHPKRTPG